MPIPDHGVRLSDLDKTRPIHLAGVAGSAMSGLALLLRQRGFEVVGTDPLAGNVRARLEAAGVRIFEEQDGSRIPTGAELAVASAALRPDHPELVAAEKRGLKVMTYAEFLGTLMSESRGIAIAGTHGKTTVTSMVVTILRHAGLSPGFVIGGMVPSLGTNADAGSSPIFVAEACEYNRSFLNLAPRIGVITCIEEDHLDFYADLKEIQAAFGSFASRLPRSEGALIYSGQCENTTPILEELSCRKLSFAVEADAVYSARNLNERPLETSFDLVHNGETVGSFRLMVPGRHNAANALAAVAVCHTLEIGFEVMVEALGRFEGASRRFDIRGQTSGVTVVDDYVHHPTEIRALLQAARAKFPERRLVVAFQPHQHSRTRYFLDQLADSLNLADQVLVTDIYAARDTEEERQLVRSSALAEKVEGLGTESEYAADMDQVVDRLDQVLERGDVLLTVGAGDIDKVVELVLDRLSNRNH